MKTLIVGQGSIGKRHARVLAPMVPALAVVTTQEIDDVPVFRDLPSALAEFAPEYIVLCSITAQHGAQLEWLAQYGFTGTVLVEKPLAMQRRELSETYPFTLHVGYNLRFHAAVMALRETLKDQRVLAAHGYVGQHLAQWRPGRVIHDTYSAHKAMGGGVVRDLSHELDLVQHWFGPIALRGAVVERVGAVTVDSEDVAGFLLSTPHCPLVTLHMNYLDPIPRRTWTVVSEQHSYVLDVIAGTLSCDGEVRAIASSGDDSYRAMHRAVLAGDATALCSLAEGLALAALIDTVAP